MGRRKQTGGGGEEGPAWLITFSDLMTLLLTFFVLLVSMAVVDERSKRVVLGSVAKHFGVGTSIPNLTAKGTTPSNTLEPGHMENLQQDDLEALRDMIFDDATKDLNFQENRYVQIFSINSEVLFAPGGTNLSERGIALLDKILPYLQRIGYPLLVAGHTASRREEEGNRYVAQPENTELDSTWLLSFRRAMSVYRHLNKRGIPPGRLSLEAFGQYRPRFPERTAEDRQKNRRVDLVLDKRNQEWIQKTEELREKNPAAPADHFYKGFRFDLTMPGQSPPPQEAP